MWTAYLHLKLDVRIIFLVFLVATVQIESCNVQLYLSRRGVQEVNYQDTNYTFTVEVLTTGLGSELLGYQLYLYSEGADYRFRK